jgi:hypothetical protein
MLNSYQALALENFRYLAILGSLNLENRLWSSCRCSCSESWSPKLSAVRNSLSSNLSRYEIYYCNWMKSHVDVHTQLQIHRIENSTVINTDSPPPSPPPPKKKNLKHWKGKVQKIREYSLLGLI